MISRLCFRLILCMGRAVSWWAARGSGVFAWITVNFLLHNLDKGSSRTTSGIIDLGGGSTQIVYEVRAFLSRGQLLSSMCVWHKSCAFTRHLHIPTHSTMKVGYI